mmetsp:Transcript_15896/g.62110  ORF Transcript_15896/g.62110 Transcript_15896/m.62110 type:complete len:475 (-) Transcript_15896:42-1466(-)
MGIEKVFRGAVVHSKAFDHLEVLNDALLGVNETGIIAFLVDLSTDADTAVEAAQKEHNFEAALIQTLSPKEVLIPGMIDTHIHASQYSYTGTGYELPLLQWLETYTFPAESLLSDEEKAREVYEKVVKRLLRCGTTSAVYFATISTRSTKLLVDIVRQLGQRAMVGKVNMDRNSPDSYVESTAQSVEDTMEFVKYVQEVTAGEEEKRLVQAVITPRFVPTCTSELMSKLGDIAKGSNLPIQSHISENPDEIEWVKSLHPDCSSYTDVYDKHGLMTSRTIMAHGVYLSEEEMETFRARGAGVSHCPVSNFNINSGVFPVHKARSHNINIGLGTDVGGGSSPNMLDVVRHAITAATVLHMRHRSAVKRVAAGGAADEDITMDHPEWYKLLTFGEAFYLATVGGAQLLGMASELGNFEAGKIFDAVIINPTAAGGPIDEFSIGIADSLVDRFQKWVMLGDDRNVKRVFVHGREVNLS